MIMKKLVFSLTFIAISLIANCQDKANIHAMIAGYKSSDTIKMADFLKLSGISLNDKDYYVVSFTMLFQDGAYDIELGSNSNKITDAMKSALSNIKGRANKIKFIVFRDINVQKAQTNKIKIDDLVCKLKLE
jgi:hypothetical protein